MSKRQKSAAQLLVPNGAGAFIVVQDRRFDKGAWPIEVPVLAEHSEHWLRFVDAECQDRNWQCLHSPTELDGDENSGSITVRTCQGEHSPELVIRWARRRAEPLHVRARLAGTPEFPRDQADGFFASVRQRGTLAKKRFYCWGQLHYEGLPWRGEIWLDEMVRLGPPSRDGGMVLGGHKVIWGPQVILVDAQVEGIDLLDAGSAFCVLLRELAVFLSVVTRTGVHVPPSSCPAAWTWTSGAEGQVECAVRWLGYVEPNRPQQMPVPGGAPSIRLKAVPRPDLSLLGLREMGETERWLPEDTVGLWKQFLALPGDLRQQFLRAGNQWRLALKFASESPTDSHAKMVVACEALKPLGEEYDHHNSYDVIEALFGKRCADILREGWFRPQDTRNGYFHRGELRGNEFSPPVFLSTFQDPSFDRANLWFRLIPPAAILEWLRLGGKLPALPTTRLAWRRKVRMSPLWITLLVVGGAGSLVLGWLLRWWFTG